MPGHKDTAPSDDSFDVLPTNPPIPPIRMDSNAQRHAPSLVPSRTVPPPPYNAQHITAMPTKAIEKREEVPAIPLRDPPPYPQQSARMMINSQIASSQQGNHVPGSAILPEEATARFITTRPQINILKAHTSLVGENQLKPSYAAPTVNSVPTHHQHQQQHQSHQLHQQHPNASQSLLASAIGMCPVCASIFFNTPL